MYSNTYLKYVLFAKYSSKSNEMKKYANAENAYSDTRLKYFCKNRLGIVFEKYLKSNTCLKYFCNFFFSYVKYAPNHVES